MTLKKLGKFRPGETLNMWLALAGQGVSSLGNYLFSFAMSLFVLDITGSAQSFSITLVVSLLPSIIIAPIAGVLTNKLPKKLMIVGADIANAALMGGMFLIIVGGNITVELIYLFTFLKSIPVALLEVVFMASSPRIVTAKKLQSIVSLRESMSACIRIAGPLLGGTMAAFIDLNYFVLFTAIAYFLSGISEFFIDFNFNPAPENEELKKEKTGFFAELIEGLRFVSKNHVIRVFLIVSLTMNFCCAAASICIPIILKTELNVSNQLYGYINTSMSVGAIFGAFLIKYKNILLSKKLGVGVNAAYGACSILFSLPVLVNMEFVTAVILCVILLVMFGMSGSFINIPSIVFVQQATPPEYIGRVSGLIMASSQLISPLGYLIFGSLTDTLGSAAVLITSGLAIFAIAGLLIRVKGLDEEIIAVYKSKGII